MCCQSATNVVSFVVGWIEAITRSRMGMNEFRELLQAAAVTMTIFIVSVNEKAIKAANNKIQSFYDGKNDIGRCKCIQIKIFLSFFSACILSSLHL
jgi:hypothetical protein